ncbi:gem-associated protein 8-like [Spodoptera litura]|uniref:Gem-associated protein 8-like n=1 Tax=Spodoptera litura TaxID=69820 RepID=A0A9J7DQH7_SPOLT|nr:gem-associated protein 8-like [Spodoptera litura]
MFFQPPNEEPGSSENLKTTSRRQKKLRRKNRLKAIKKDQLAKKRLARNPIPTTMSSWAENFTSAATWQLKHQVAFWKSRATALEYENKLLHDIIRKNYLNQGQSDDNSRSNSEEEEEYFEPENEVEEDVDGEIEVSEEFIQFLRDNKKFRDDAKRERERLRAQNDEEQREIEEMEAGPIENGEDPQERLKKLYGRGWERISALEMSMQSHFISISDREKPMYWPNIPFNFNFG